MSKDSNQWQSKEPCFCLYVSVYKAITESGLSERMANTLLRFTCDYYLEPCGYAPDPSELPEKARLVWAGISHRIECAKSVARTKRARSRGQRNSEQSDGESQEDGYELGGEPHGEPVHEVGNTPSPAESHEEPTDVSPEVPNDSMGLGIGFGTGIGSGFGMGAGTSEGVDSSIGSNKDKVVFSEGGKERLPLRLRDMSHDDKVEAVCDYASSMEFNAVITAYDAIEKWVSQWEERGWIDVNEASMDALVTPKNGTEKIPRWQNMFNSYAEGAEDKAIGLTPAEKWNKSKCHKCGGDALWRIADGFQHMRCQSCGDYEESINKYDSPSPAQP